MKKLSFYLLAALIAFTTSCKKSSDDQPDTTTPPASTAVTIESTPQITVKIDGTSYSKVVDHTTIENGVGSDKSLVGFPDTSSAKYDSFFTDASYTVTYFRFLKGTMRFQGSAPVNTSFKAFFHTGGCSFSSGAANGIAITYYDNSGIEWSTDLGSQDQTGSSFSITDMKEMTGTGDYTVKVKASFNCKLYNSGGASKTLTEGTFIGYFSNI